MDTVRAFFTKSGHFFWIFMIGQGSSPPCPPPLLSSCVPAILYYTIHYTTLHYTTLHYTTLHYTTLHYTILYYTILYYTILYSTLLYYTILLYKPPYYTIITLFNQKRKHNQNNKISRLISHMAFLQAAPLVGTTKPSSSVPEILIGMHNF